MLAGNKQCWSYLLFRFLFQLKYPIHPLFEPSNRRRAVSVPRNLFDVAWAQEIDENDVLAKLHDFWSYRITHAVQADGTICDPRATGIKHARICKYVAWSMPAVGPLKRYHEYMYTCLSKLAIALPLGLLDYLGCACCHHF